MRHFLVAEFPLMTCATHAPKIPPEQLILGKSILRELLANFLPMWHAIILCWEKSGGASNGGGGQWPAGPRQAQNDSWLSCHVLALFCHGSAAVRKWKFFTKGSAHFLWYTAQRASCDHFYQSHSFLHGGLVQKYVYSNIMICISKEPDFLGIEEEAFDLPFKALFNPLK